MLNGLEGIYRNGAVVGFLRRAEFAHVLNKPIAYGYVERELLEKAGASRRNRANVLSDEALLEGQYSLDRMGQRVSASVHLHSPFDTHNKRIRGDYYEYHPADSK